MKDDIFRLFPPIWHAIGDEVGIVWGIVIAAVIGLTAVIVKQWFDN
jgi:tetrahydromethanopterin S-methyltransferase subunit G